ncbi:MAG: ABC transporter transmembrane domain-containing protein [Legionella sp.]
MKKRIHAIAQALDKTTITSIVMISILVSLLTLSIPVASQTLVNLIAFGKVLQPVITLSIIILVIMLAVGALNIWQSVIIEVIQQKIIVNISVDLTKQFTHLSLHNFTTHNGPELVNRYFEVMTINKALAHLLLYGINYSLQLICSLILLLFYHPIFLIFDAFVLICLVLIIFIPYHKGSQSADEECFQKHQIGAWLEELLANRFLFRFNKNYQYAIKQTDHRLVSFLKARNTHFNQLIKHQLGFYLLSALASSLLFGLGGYLVINDQLSLGQLVAAEIILGALINSFKRFYSLLENYYDLVASEHKIDTVLNLERETIKTELHELITPIETITIHLGNHIASCKIGEQLLIGVNESIQSRLISDYIVGIRHGDNWALFINNLRCLPEHQRTLCKTALLVRNNEWFAGSIYDNLCLNHPCLTKELNDLLREFGLINKILGQPNGLKTIIYDWEAIFSDSELTKMLTIRALIAKPPLIIFDGVFDNLDKSELKLIIAYLNHLKESICIIFSQNPGRIDLANRLVLS